jgi:23S rRNA (pseudouridine1915-N3)-methyltransferase
LLKLKTIVVDRTRSPFLKEGESFYLKRLRRYVQMEWIEVKPAKIKKGRSDKEILAIESRSIQLKLAPKDYLVATHSTGHSFNSEELAGWLDGLSTRIGGWVTFVIGGPLGLSQDLLNQSHKILSLSRLTLTHEMARLVLLEQLYRAFTILRGGKYNK